MEKKTKICPYCGEEIMASAKKCRYCGEWLVDETEKINADSPSREETSITSQIQPETKQVAASPVPSVTPQVMQPNTTLNVPKKLGFLSAVKKCYRKLAVYEGRASRNEFWYYFLFMAIVGAVIGVVSQLIISMVGLTSTSLITATVLLMAYSLVVGMPYYSVATRRLHDVGRSGWNWFFVLIPIAGPLILLYFFVKGSDGDNEYNTTIKQDDDLGAVKLTPRDHVVVGVLTGVIVLIFVLNIFIIRQNMRGLQSVDTEIQAPANNDERPSDEQSDDSTEDSDEPDDSGIAVGTYQGEVNGQPMTLVLEDNGDGTVKGTFSNDNNGISWETTGEVGDNNTLSLEGETDDGITVTYSLSYSVDENDYAKLSGKFRLGDLEWIPIELDYVGEQ